MILVSACLAGQACRYDGGAFEPAAAIARMVAEGQAVPVCPEVLGGLPTPRLPAEIQGGDGSDVLAGTARIRRVDGLDVTEAFRAGAEATLEIARACGATAAVLKADSPSCGVKQIHDGAFAGGRVPGMGLTAAMLDQAGLALYDEADPLPAST